MAKKSKKKKQGRRRLSGTKLNVNNPLVKYAPIVAGFLLGDKINTAIDGVVKGKLDGKILAAGEAGIGAALVFMKLGKKQTVVQTVAGGVLLGAGLKRAMKEFGIMNGIGGYGAVPVLGGYGDVPVLGSNRRRVNGYVAPGQLGSYVAPGQLSAANMMKPDHMKIIGSMARRVGS